MLITYKQANKINTNTNTKSAVIAVIDITDTWSVEFTSHSVMHNMLFQRRDFFQCT